MCTIGQQQKLVDGQFATKAATLRFALQVLS